VGTKIQIFENDRFGEVRVTEIEGKTYFVGNDIAKALGYERPTKAIQDHCKGVLKWDILTNGGIQEMSVIPEGDIYRLAAKSQLPGAEDFESWIFDEVLPSVRKHGGYLTPAKTEELLMNPDLIIQMATSLKDERQKRLEAETKVREQAPKVLFADAVATSNKSVLVSELAKILRQNGIEMGQNRLFTWLRENGYLCSKGEYYNQPSQKAMELGLFEIKKTSIIKPDGSILVTVTTKVNGRGQIYFVDKFLSGKKGES